MNERDLRNLAAQVATHRSLAPRRTAAQVMARGQHRRRVRSAAAATTVCICLAAVGILAVGWNQGPERETQLLQVPAEPTTATPETPTTALSDSSPTLVTYEPNGPAMTAILPGALELRNSCIILRLDNGGELPLVFPNGTSLESRDGEWFVLTVGGRC